MCKWFKFVPDLMELFRGRNLSREVGTVLESKNTNERPSSVPDRELLWTIKNFAAQIHTTWKIMSFPNQ